jgi:hypothetical protein
MHSATHSVRYFSKKPIPLSKFLSFSIPFPSFKSSVILQDFYHFFAFQDFAVRNHFPVHDERRRAHHAVGGNLRKIRHVVHGIVHTELPEGVFRRSLQLIALVAAAAQDLTPRALSFGVFGFFRGFRVTAAAAATFFFFFFC